MNISSPAFLGDRNQVRADARAVMVPHDTFTKARNKASHAKINVTDLLAGAGGFSLGFEVAGYHVQSAIEIDSWACETLSENHIGTNVIKASLTEISDAELKAACAGSKVIVGGPSCQGYSVANLKAGDPTDP